MGPTNSRLLKRARSTRRFLVATVLLGVTSAALIVVQALLIARLVVAGFEDGDSANDLRGMLVALLFVIVIRAVVVWIGEVVSNAGAARGKSELRMAVLRHVMQLGPTWLAGRDSGELSTLFSTGIDSLDAYYARYLPQVVLALVVPPIVIVAILTQDPLSALLVLLTLPLIPLFMAVVGKFTGRTVERQWDALSRLSGHFLDVVAGLPTLKAFGRAKAQSAKLASSGAEYRRTTMKVLRISFLSSLVLELVATLSVAIVAVAIGLRLVYGDLTLVVGLTALLLAPEAYLPLRQLAQNYHSAAEGIGAANRMLGVLDEPVPSHGGRQEVPDLSNYAIVLNDVTVTYPGRTVAAIEGYSLTITPGRVTALTGENGAGKSTVLALLMRFVGESAGSVSLRDPLGTTIELSDFDPEAWRSRVSYLPQAPYLAAGTVAEAVRLGNPAKTDAEVSAVLADAGLDLEHPPVRRVLPRGLETQVGEGGVGLSAGQIRRVALARTLLQEAPVILLDEPAAALDSQTEQTVVNAIGALRRSGRTVVVVAHRAALLAVADVVVRLEAPREDDARSDVPSKSGHAEIQPQAWAERA